MCSPRINNNNPAQRKELHFLFRVKPLESLASCIARSHQPRARLYSKSSELIWTKTTKLAVIGLKDTSPARTDMNGYMHDQT